MNSNQVEALKNFLGHDYENLLLVDIVCHGVPSNRMLKDYLDFLSKKKKKAVNSIQFRTKTKGQNVAGEIIYKKSGQKEKDQYEREPLVAYKSSYYSLFLKCQTFRESCYHCKFSGSERAGDITLCDYWGIEDEHPDFLKEVSDEGLVGISAVMLNNQTGKNYFSEIERAFKLKESTFEQVAAHNPQLTSPSVESPIRHEILKNYRLNGYEAVDDFYHRKYRLKILTSDLGRVLPNSWKKAILQMIRGRR